MTRSTPHGGRGPIRVFILDDHELMRRGLCGVLDAAPDIEVVAESSSAAEAIRRIPALRPDVALLDVRLPDGTGIEVCRAVRAVDPGIQALMITSFDDDDARAAALLAGAAGFVLKQIRGTELVDAVRRVGAGEHLPPPATSTDAGVAAGVGHLALDSLTPQERRVLDLIVDGLTNADIGVRLGISEKTVRNHVTSVLAKLGFARRTQAAVYMVRHNG
jgi:two-component system, NarL family, response regulator DevR